MFPYMKEAAYGAESIYLKRNLDKKFKCQRRILHWSSQVVRIIIQSNSVHLILVKVKHVFFPLHLPWAGQSISENVSSFTDVGNLTSQPCWRHRQTGLTKFPRRVLHVSGSDARFGWCHFLTLPILAPWRLFWGFFLLNLDSTAPNYPRRPPMRSSKAPPNKKNRGLF